jgi:hypothetical protein
MSKQLTERDQLRQATSELQSGAHSREVTVRGAKIIISRLQRTEVTEGLPEEYPKIDLPPADNYDSWLK